MVSINSETILPRWTAILEVVEINVKQIGSSRLVVFAVKCCVRIKLVGGGEGLATYVPGLTSHVHEPLHPSTALQNISQGKFLLESFWNRQRHLFKIKY